MYYNLNSNASSHFTLLAAAHFISAALNHDTCFAKGCVVHLQKELTEHSNKTGYALLLSLLPHTILSYYDDVILRELCKLLCAAGTSI